MSPQIFKHIICKHNISKLFWRRFKTRKYVLNLAKSISTRFSGFDMNSWAQTLTLPSFLSGPYSRLQWTVDVAFFNEFYERNRLVFCFDVKAKPTVFNFHHSTQHESLHELVARSKRPFQELFDFLGLAFHVKNCWEVLKKMCFFFVENTKQMCVLPKIRKKTDFFMSKTIILQQSIPYAIQIQLKIHLVRAQRHFPEPAIKNPDAHRLFLAENSERRRLQMLGNLGRPAKHWYESGAVWI